MDRKIDNPAKYRFEGRMIVVMSSLALMTVLIIWSGVHFHLHPTGALAYVSAALVSLVVIGPIIVFGLYLADEKDEFERAIQVQSMLWSIGATLSVTTIWGSLENFDQVPHGNLFWAYPIFCFFMGISKLLVKLRYK